MTAAGYRALWDLLGFGMAGYFSALIMLWMFYKTTFHEYVMMLNVHPSFAMAASGVAVLACGIIIYVKFLIIRLLWSDGVKSAIKIFWLCKNPIYYYSSYVVLVFAAIFVKIKPFAKALKNFLTICFILAFIALPNTTNTYADASFSTAQKTYLEGKVRALTANDATVTFMTYIFGSAIEHIKANVLSLNYITASKGATADLSGGGLLDLDYKDLLTPPSNKSDILSKDDGSGTPDGPLGITSLYIGQCLMILLVFASAYRLTVMYAIESVDSIGDPRSQTAMFKRMGVSGVSASLSSLIATPIYKGYTILTLFLFHVVLIGVAFSNAFLMNYFENAIANTSPTPYVTDNGDLLYSNMAEKMLCVQAAKYSSQITIQTGIEPHITDDKAQIVLDYGVCGLLNINSEEDLIGPDKLGRAVYANNGWDTTKVTQVRTYVVDKYIGILSDFQNAIKLIVDKYAKVSQTYQFDDFIAACNQIQRTGVAEGGEIKWDEWKKFDKDGTWTKSCTMTDTSISDVATAKANYRKAMVKLREQVVQLMADKLKLTTDKDGKRDIVEFNDSSSSESPVDIDDPSTYQYYSLGWVEFPFHMAYRNYISRRTANWLKFSLDNPTEDISGVNDYALVDAVKTDAIKVYIENLQSKKNSLNSLSGSLDKANALLGNEGFSWSRLTNLDAAASNAIAILIADFFMVDPGESVIAEYADAGNTIINIWIGLHAAMGGVSGALDSGGGIMSAVTGYLGGAITGNANKSDLKTALKNRAGNEPKSKGGMLKSAMSTVAKVGLKFVGGPIVGAIIGSLVGAFQAYKTMLKPLLEAVIPFAIFCAYVLPLLHMFYFSSCALKWLLQVVKMSILSSVAAIKVWANDGRDLFSTGVKDILMGAVATAVIPMIIMGLFIMIDGLMTPLTVFYQQMAYKVVNVTFADTAQGPLYIVVMVGTIVVPVVYMMLYLFSFPGLIQDAIIQYMSLNLGFAGSSHGMNSLGSAMGAVKSMKPNLTGGGGGGEGGGESGSGGGRGTAKGLMDSISAAQASPENAATKSAAAAKGSAHNAAARSAASKGAAGLGRAFKNITGSNKKI
ncbi:hypothetical protein V6259_13055 [Marinomonas sp. TI.3.20]|uniref:hypothetical protein n=1 Tax=Marinomonas sp. TI.3.20 TaxID=3121296 RepID=UPI00311D66FE